MRSGVDETPDSLCCAVLNRARSGVGEAPGSPRREALHGVRSGVDEALGTPRREAYNGGRGGVTPSAVSVVLCVTTAWRLRTPTHPNTIGASNSVGMYAPPSQPKPLCVASGPGLVLTVGKVLCCSAVAYLVLVRASALRNCPNGGIHARDDMATNPTVRTSARCSPLAQGGWAGSCCVRCCCRGCCGCRGRCVYYSPAV